MLVDLIALVLADHRTDVYPGREVPWRWSCACAGPELLPNNHPNFVDTVATADRHVAEQVAEAIESAFHLTRNGGGDE